MCDTGSIEPRYGACRSLRSDTDNAPKVLPCHDRRRAMNRFLVGSPFAQWKWSAIFSADSTASEPPHVNTICCRSDPARRPTISVSSSNGSLLKLYR
jgi:hypothetical protein